LAEAKHLSHSAMWVISSVGRASALHAEGRRFEPVITHQLFIKIFGIVCHEDNTLGRLFT
jgi:hypothetical protein